MGIDMKKLVTATALCAAAFLGTASAATLTVDMNQKNGSAAMPATIVLEDIDGGVRFNVKLDTINALSGDIVAVYADVLGDPGDFAISSIGPNPPVTAHGFDTKNIQAGNIGQKFDFAFAIGETGLKGGADQYQDFSFVVRGTGLDVTDFLGQTFALRGQSIGANGASAKQFGLAGTTVDIIDPVPVPGAGLLLLGGLGAFAAARRKRS
jgi:hypothetical protein